MILIIINIIFHWSCDGRDLCSLLLLTYTILISNVPASAGMIVMMMMMMMMVVMTIPLNGVPLYKLNQDKLLSEVWPGYGK
jgi:hypothetical protein